MAACQPFPLSSLSFPLSPSSAKVNEQEGLPAVQPFLYFDRICESHKTMTMHTFVLVNCGYVSVHTHFTPQREGICNGYIACCFISFWLLQSNGLVVRYGSFLEHLSKQAAMTINLQLPTAAAESPSSFQQLKLVQVFSLLQCMRSHGKGQAIPDMVLPTIPMREVELKGFGDTSAIVVDVHCHTTELVALW